MPAAFLTTATPLTQDGTQALLATLRQHEPDLAIHVIVAGDVELPGDVTVWPTSAVAADVGLLLEETLNPEERTQFALPYVAEQVIASTGSLVYVAPGCLVAGRFTEIGAALDDGASLVLAAVSYGKESHTLTPELHTLTRRTQQLTERVFAISSGAGTALTRWQAAQRETFYDVFQRVPSNVTLAMLSQFLGDGDVRVAGTATFQSWVEHASIASGRAGGELCAVVEVDRLVAMARDAQAHSGDGDEVEVAWQLLADNVHDSRPLEPLVEALATAAAEHTIPVDTTTPYDVFAREIRRSSDPEGNRWPAGETAGFEDWLYDTDSQGVTRLAHLLWRRREDLWHLSISPRRDATAMRAWAQNAGAYEFGRDPFRRSARPQKPREAAEPSALANALAWRANRLAAVVPGFEKRQVRKRLVHGPAPITDRGIAAPKRVEVIRAADHFAPAPRPLAIIGCFRAESGLGQAARASLNAVELLGRDYSWIDTSEQYPSRNAVDPGLVGRRPFGAAGDVNLLHSNADELLTLNQQVFRDRIAGRFNVAMWFWETADLPQRSLPAFDAVDELWVASEYLVDVFGQYAHVPVYNIGLAADLPELRQADRSSFGLADDEFVFLFVYDALSSHGRKNPEKTLRAFIDAFGPSYDGVRFVLKVSNLNKFPASQSRIMAMVAECDAITVIDEYFPRARVMDLMTVADVYVSLHAAEGYGLTLLEAMALGTPVICTAYSGNMDFTTDANSWLVDFEMMETDEPTGPYPPGSVWAAPNVDSAADLMRAAASSPAEVARKRELAITDARESASLEHYAERLDAQLRRVL